MTKDKNLIEHQYKNLFAFLSLSSEIIIVVSKEVIVAFNDVAKEFFTARFSELLGNNILSLITEDVNPNFKLWMEGNRIDDFLVSFQLDSLSLSEYQIRAKEIVENNETLTLLSLTPLQNTKLSYSTTNLIDVHKGGLGHSSQLFFEWNSVKYDCKWGENLESFFEGRVAPTDRLNEFYSYVHADDQDALRDSVRFALLKNTNLSFEFRILMSDKSVKWLRMIGEVQNHEGTKKLIGAILDVDDAKHNEEFLNQQESFLQGILKNMKEVFFRTDLNGDIVFLNDAAKSFFAYENLNDLLGKHVGVLYFDPSDRTDLLNALKRHKQLDGYEITLKTKDSERLFVKVSVKFYYTSEGDIAGTEGLFYDVTKSKESELGRQRILEEFRNTLSSANIHIYRYKKNEEGKIIFTFSEGKLPVLDGHTTMDVYGKTFEEVYDKPLEGEEYNAMQMAFDGNSRSFIAQWDGVYYQSDVSPFAIEDGKVTEIIGVIYNINEVIKAEKALVESEERYKSLVENAQDGIVIVKDSVFVFVNQTFVKLLGYSSKKEIIGKSIDEIIYSSEKDKVLSNHQNRMKGSQVERIYETSLKAKNGSSIPVEINNNIIYFSGKKAGLTFVRDLTQSKKDEQEMLRLNQQNSALLDVFPLMYLVVDKNGVISNLNIPESIGLEDLRPHVSVGANFRTLGLKPKNHEKVSYYYQKVFETGQIQRFSLREQIKSKNLHLEFRIIKLSENEVLTTIDDITDRLEYQKRLIFAKEKAEESDRLKSAFLANMSHEIRTPMNAILGFAEMLSYPDLQDEERVEFVNIIKRRSYDLLHIINDIIDVSKMEAGLMNFNIEPTSINLIIKDVIDSFLSNEKVRNGKLKLEFKLGLTTGEDQIMIDPVRLKQVFINLINNALKFTDQGHVQLSYTVVEEMLRFEIEDTGIGIKEESQAIIFDRFMQADMDKNRNYGGTGLGLTISKNIVEKLGGTIGFESEFEKGSCFFFTVPYFVANEKKTYPKEELATDILIGKKVLIAEDEDTNYLVISSILEKYKVNCFRAVDGMEAIKKVQENDNYDLILMDIRMPKLNGIEATTEITRISKTPVVMQTAYAFDKDINQALEAGAKDFVAKPISASKLVKKMIQHMK